VDPLCSAGSTSGSPITRYPSAVGSCSRNPATRHPPTPGPTGSLAPHPDPPGAAKVQSARRRERA
jgi:hypothetical protein